MIRYASILLLLCAASCATQPQAPQAPADLQKWRTRFSVLAEKNLGKVYNGDLDGYVAAVRSETKVDDWVSQLVAGDLVYRVSPVAATPFHQAALKLAPTEGVLHLELAYDYQRAGDCNRAIPEWQAADKLRALGGPATAIAAYCFFRVGRIDEALALWDRIQWPANRIALDFALAEMAMGTQALDTHIQALAKARRGDDKAFNTLIGNALDWKRDWWNSSESREAFDVVRALAKELKPADLQLARELDCANEVIAAKNSAAVPDILRRYRFVIEGGELPKNSEVAKYLFSRISYLDAFPKQELLDRHRATLDARARSAEGDIAALEILAFLQVSVRDKAGLKASDELGWRRYHVAKFAVSRVLGSYGNDDGWKSGGEALLAEALNEFPEQAELHKLRYEKFPPPVAERQQYLMQWLFAEYAGVTRNIVGTRTSTPLASVVHTLRKNREGR
ncbi:MAG: hypothetical protein QM776_17665 [Rhodocyclaceae bacterium]